MASTFTLNSTSYDGRYLQVALTQTKDAANRRSKITGTVTTMAGNSGWYATGATTVTVAGTQRYTRARESNGNGQSQRGFVGTISEFYVSHDTAGNASVSVEISTAIYYSAQKATSETWTLDSIGAATTSCGAPTACSVNSTLAESNVTLSWSGAKSGTNNTISSYEIQYSESSNNSDWGSWAALTTVTTTSTSGSTSVAPPSTRGYFRRFRVRTRGSAGSSYYSGWKTSTNSVRKNTAPSAPTSVSASPTTYSNKTITVSWSGASGGTSSIKGYQIASRTSTDNSSWSAWNVLATLILAASSGSYNPTVSSTPGTYTQFGVWTIDALNVYSGEKVSNSIYCNITACGAPTTLSVNQTIAEGNVTLSWSGASGGAGNAINGYTIQYSESANGTTWGSWAALTTVTITASSGSLSVSPPSTRGYYRRFRIQTRGSAGSSYYSGWKTSSNSVRKNTLPTPPNVFSANPSVYESGTISLSWSGTVAGTSAIAKYVIQQSTSENNTSWSDWTTLKTINTGAAAGITSTTPPTSWKFLRYRISVTDALSAISDYTVSNTVYKNIQPLPVLIESPKAGGITYNTTPRILIETQAEPDGLPQTIFVTATDGNTYNSVDNPGMFSTGGSSATAVKTVFTNPQTAPGIYSVSVLCKDEISSGTAVSRSFTIAEPNFETITANQTHVKARHIADLRTAVNNVRDYFNLPAYSWGYEIIPGRTNAAYWVYHIIELRAAIQGVVDKINMYDTSVGARIPEILWLPLGTGRPRADVMEQLATTIRNL